MGRMKSAWGLHMLLWTLLLGVAAMGCAGSRTGLSAMTLAEEWALGAKLHERLALSNAGGSLDCT